jgi:hypothetical protein
MGHGTIIYKTATAEFLDEFYASPSGLSDATALLDAHASDPLWTTTDDLNSSFGLDPAAGNADDFRNYWLSEASQYGAEQVDRVLRHGYREAIRIAREEYPEPGAPIETFWVAGGSDHFHLQICKGRRAVTVFMFVPTARRFGSRQAEAQTFVVRAGGLREDDADLLDDDGPPIIKQRVSGSDRGAQA